MKREKRKMNIAVSDPKFIDSLYRKYQVLHGNCDEEEMSTINKNFLTELKKHITFEEREVDLFLPESTKEIKEKNNPEFIKGILDVFSKKNYRIHATQSAEKILENGLLVRSFTPDLGHTSFALVNLTDNEILNKLYNEMHRYQTQIIVIDADDSDLVEYKGKYLLPSERIKLYIDLEKQEIIKNPKFKEDLERVDDRSVDRENKEIEISESENFFKNQLDVFQKVLRTSSRDEIDNTNEEIYSFINAILLHLESGPVDLPKDIFDRLYYYVAQVDNDVYKSLKVIKRQEEEKQKQCKKQINKESVQNSELSLDATDDLF